MSTIKKIFISVVMLASCFISAGCVSYRTPLPSSGNPQQGLAYVYGQLTHNGLGKMALVLEQLDSGEKQRIKFTLDGEVALYEIPTGPYKINEYTVALAGAIWEHEWNDIPYTSCMTSKDFTLEPGVLYYIGDYVGSNERGGDMVTAVSQSGASVGFSGYVDSCTDNFDNSTKRLLNAYPRFIGLPIKSIRAP